MFLLIDMSLQDQIHLALFNDEKKMDKVFTGRNNKLLISIDTFFKENNFDKNDLKGIMIVVGTGSFTSTRIACVLGNTFAYTLKIPLLAINIDELDNIQVKIKELLSQPIGQYISATYSAEPNIGGKAKCSK